MGADPGRLYADRQVPRERRGRSRPAAVRRPTRPDGQRQRGDQGSGDLDQAQADGRTEYPGSGDGGCDHRDGGPPAGGSAVAGRQGRDGQRELRQGRPLQGVRRPRLRRGPVRPARRSGQPATWSAYRPFNAPASPRATNPAGYGNGWRPAAGSPNCRPHSTWSAAPTWATGSGTRTHRPPRDAAFGGKRAAVAQHPRGPGQVARRSEPVREMCFTTWSGVIPAAGPLACRNPSP